MIVDIVIVLFAVSSFFRGREIGFVRQLFSTIGFVGGLFLGALLQKYTVQFATDANSRAVITLVTTLCSALALLLIGEYIGLRLKHKVMVTKMLNEYDNDVGAVLSVISLLFSVWLMASIANALPFPTIETQVKQSHIVSFLDNRLPQAPTVIAGLGRLIDPNGFPQVFIGSEPIPKGNVNLPALGDFEPVVNRDKASVVKVAGQGCGGIVEGSGFVISHDMIATNAHVIAGIKKPTVQDQNGLHDATVIWFDPNLDFAILRTSNLAGSPLVINTKLASNKMPAAVVGYPGGGPFTASSAVVLDSFTASGRNIYGTGQTNRSVYELQANVIPGNSGGPLLAQDGSVIGVIFAESTSYKHVGYALTTPAVINEINQASASTKTVSTGQCAA